MAVNGRVQCVVKKAVKKAWLKATLVEAKLFT